MRTVLRWWGPTLAAGLALTGCGGLFDSSVPGEDLPDSGLPGMGGGLPFGEACEETDDCRTGLVCTADGTCGGAGNGSEGAQCQLTASCAEGLYCAQDGKCTVAGDGEEGARCDGTGDCEAGLVCALSGLASKCQPAGDVDLGDACASTGECLAGLVCRPELPSGGETKCLSPSNTIPELPPFWEGASCTEDDGPATAYFRVPRGETPEADFYRLPFPNDVRRTESGLDLSGHPTPGDPVGLGVDMLAEYIQASEQDLQGFATNPVVYFRFSQPYDGTTVNGPGENEQGKHVQLFEISPDAEAYGRPLSREWGTSRGPVTQYVCEDWLNVRSPTPLRPGTTYAVVLTRGITPRDGTAFQRDADLDALLSDTPPEDAALQDAYADYAPLRAFVADPSISDAAKEAVGAGGENILNAAVFTTQDPLDLIPALRDVVRGGEAPAISDLTLCDTGVTSPCDDGDVRVCDPAQDGYHEIHGRIALPQFQAGTPPFETPADGGAIARDASGVPQVARSEEVCFALTVPKGVDTPEAGFPLLIFGHGTGGSFKSAIHNGLASALGGAGTPAATLTIDLPQHGSRKAGSDRGADELFYNFLNPRAARDNVAQGSADLMALVRWAQQYDAAADSLPIDQAVRFDADRLGLYGHSQGATHASLIVPYEDGVRGVALSGVGGKLSRALVSKREPVDIASAVPVALLDPEAAAPSDCAVGSTCLGEHHPALALLQGFFERVDPINYGYGVQNPPEGGTAKHVFMIYGLDDSYSPEGTQKAYARAARLDHVAPELVDIRGVTDVQPPVSLNEQVAETDVTQGMRQYAPDEGEDGHFVAFRADKGQPDLLRFLQGLLSGGDPQIGE